MPQPVTEWSNVDVQTFRERIFPGKVMRGLVADWPVVAEGRTSPQATADYLLGLEQGGPLPLITAPPAVKGRLEQRAVWRNLFDYYLFQTSGDPLSHLAPEFRGPMGGHGKQALQAVRTLLLRSLSGS